MIDISPADEMIVNAILKKHVAKCEVRAFGSRHKWTAKSYSDLDLAIVGTAKLDKSVIYALQEAFEESELSFRVDVLDWYAISDEFRQIIEQGYSVIQEKEIDNQLPAGWTVKKLGDVVDYISDRVSVNLLSNANYISTENMLSNYGGITISSGLPNSSNAAEFINEDILISNIRPYFKKIWLADKNGGCSNDVLVLRNKDKNKFCTKFLYYALANNHFFDYVMAGSRGTKMPRGDKAQISHYSMLIPSLEEQKEIAAILSSLDDKIELNRQTNQTLEEMAQSIFKEWFIDFNFPDENGNPYRDSGGTMIDSELGQIPASWSVGKLGDYAVVASGKRPRKRHDTQDAIFSVPLYGASGIMGYVESILFDKRLLVIGRVGTHGVINRVSGKSWLSDNTLVIDGKYYNFLYFVLKNIDYASLNRGAVQPLVTQTDIKNYQIIVPCHNVMEQFENIVTKLFNDIDNNLTQTVSLMNCRDTLLPKLMSGNMNISVGKYL